MSTALVVPASMSWHELYRNSHILLSWLKVADVMTEASEVFMLPWNATLSFKLLREIFYSGFSRIPVHGPSGRDEIIGLIFVKDLIFVDPEDETPVKRFAEILGRTFEVVDDDAQV